MAKDVIEALASLEIDEGLVLGIDLGIGSCGWAVLSPEAAPHLRLIGSRCFPIPEQPKTKELTNKVRRDARGQRRVVRRRRQRMRRLRDLLVSRGVVPDAGPQRFRAASPALDPWAARTAGLERRLEPEEWGAALIHIAKHRGFQSNSKRDGGANAPPDTKKVLAELYENEALSARYRTVGQMIASDPKFAARKRNTTGDYSHTVKRDQLRHEVRALFDEQRRLGNPSAAPELEAAYAELALSQRPLQDSHAMVGPCPFEPGEKRAPRQGYSFELFRFLSRLAALRVAAPGELPRRLAEAEIRDAARDFGEHQSVTYKALRKRIGLPDAVRFEGVAADAEGANLTGKSGKAAWGTAQLRDALGPTGWAALIGTPAVLDEIATVLAFRDDPGSIRAGLSALGLAPPILGALTDALDAGRFAEFRGPGHISALACRKLNPELLRGLDYSEACAAVGFDHAKARTVALDGIRNAVVRRSLREALAQIAAIVREIGRLPGAIHLELARDLGKSTEERAEMRAGLDRRESEKERHREEFRDLTKRPRCSDEDLLRYELWKEQLHRCPYSDHDEAYIDPEDIAADSNAVQVDHILPRSLTQDNSYHNLVLCKTRANQDKGQRSPWQWRGQSDPAWWAGFTTRVETLRIKGYKKRNLLLRNLEGRQEEFVRRNLNDTRYVCRALLQELLRLFPATKGERRRVQVFPGSLTSMLRKAWGVDGLKKDADGNRLPDDRHHALDAAIVALCTPRTLHSVTVAYQRLEAEARAKLVPPVAVPWTGFRDGMVAALEAVLVSRSETRRGRGEGHAATIRQVREEDGERVVYERKAVEKLTLADLDRVKDGADRNRPTVEALRRWIEAGKPKAGPPLSPKGDPIGKISLRHKAKAGLAVRGGYAENGGMVRVDVFRKAGKHYLVPIYVHQIVDKARYPQPPNIAIVAYQDEEKWKPIDGTYEFRFSLYPDSYLRLVKRDGSIIEGYYRSSHRGTGALAISPDHSSSELVQGIGAQTLLEFRKFGVDRLGRKHEIVQETRTWHGAACT